MSALEAFRDFATGAGILIAGGWAIWKWGYTEWRERAREIPSMEGQLMSEQILLGRDRCLVSCAASWRNVSSFPIHIDKDKSYFEVGEILPITDGVILSQFIPSKLKEFPLANKKSYVFEPQKRGDIYLHFSTELNKSFLIIMKLFRSTEHHGKEEFAWTIEKVISTHKIVPNREKIEDNINFV